MCTKETPIVAWRLCRSAALTLILAMNTAGCGERQEDIEVRGFGTGGIQLPYSASLVGSDVCVGCHDDQAERHDSHRMALTGKPVSAESQHLWFADEALARPTDWSTTAASNRAPRYQKTDYGVFLVHPDDDSRRIEAEAVFGSGAHGFTPIGIEDGRTVVELSLSFLAHREAWALTPGQEMGPDPLGRRLSAEDGDHCLSCHMTSVAWRGDTLDWERSVSGVQCERCHGPGSAHLEAVTTGQDQSHIFDPGDLSAKEQVEFCGQCHRQSLDLDPNEIINEHPSNSRHAGAGLMLSACYRQSPPETAITCTDCHNPHENIAAGATSFNNSCLRCHSALTVHADPALDATTDCVDCHMRQVASLGDIIFTNHWIRVPEQPRTLPDGVRQEYMSHMDSVYRRALLDRNLGPLAQADLLTRVAQAANALGNRKLAMARYEEALSLGPRYETRIGIADEYARMGQEADAAAILEGAADLEPRLRIAYQKLARSYMDRGDPGRAEQAIRRWSENVPGDWLPGVTLMTLGRFAAAEAEFKRILHDDPATAPAYLHLGNVQMFRGQIREAIEYYRQALEIAPDYLEAQVELGQSLAQIGNENEAIGQLRRALEIQPRSAPGHTELGLVFAKQGDFDRASYHLLEALAIDPGIGKAHGGLGTVRESQGRESDAIHHYREAMELGPTRAIAARLAWMLAASSDVSLRDGDEAVRLAKSMVKLTEGKDPVIMHTLAAAYAETGDVRSADTVSRRGLGLLEGDTSVAAGRLREKLRLYLYEQIP